MIFRYVSHWHTKFHLTLHHYSLYTYLRTITCLLELSIWRISFLTRRKVVQYKIYVRLDLSIRWHPVYYWSWTSQTECAKFQSDEILFYCCRHIEGILSFSNFAIFLCVLAWLPFRHLPDSNEMILTFLAFIVFRNYGDVYY